MAFGRRQANADERVVGRKLREQRKSSRQKVGASAWIRPDGGFAKRPCRLLDISETGVRLAIEPGADVPSIFNFAMSSGGLGRRARIKWRNGTQIGAEFL